MLHAKGQLQVYVGQLPGAGGAPSSDHGIPHPDTAVQFHTIFGKSSTSISGTWSVPCLP